LPKERAKPASHPRADQRKTASAGIELVGNKLISAKTLRAQIGREPAEIGLSWMRAAQKGVLGYYRSRGYTKARCWIVERDPAQKPGTKEHKRRHRYTLHIDEGKLHAIHYVGAGTLRVLILQFELYLPEKVFHQKTLQDALARIKKRYRLRDAYFRVEPLYPGFRAPDGSLVPRRKLRVYFVSSQAVGWGLGVALSSTWGFVPHLSLAKPALFAKEDRLSARIAVAFPYRAYLFDESPSFRWVHGLLRLRYRFSPLWGIAPVLQSEASLSRLQRVDLGLDGYLLGRTHALTTARFALARRFSAEVGVGYSRYDVVDIALTEEAKAAASPPSQKSRHLGGVIVKVDSRFALGERALNQGMQSGLQLAVSLEYASMDVWLTELFARFRNVLSFGDYHALLIEAQGMAQLGKVNFWNESPLSRFNRTFFDNRFWVREAMSLSLDLRISLKRDLIKIGVFHDVVLFGDRRRGPVKAGLANAFGPGLHFLLFDAFALDIQYAFGFSAEGFDHNFIVSMKRVF
jgi:hypothetical protein